MTNKYLLWHDESSPLLSTLHYYNYVFAVWSFGY